MPTDRAGDPWSDSTYNGFAGAPAARPPPPPEQRRVVRPALTGRNLAIGAAAAVAFGLVFGLWAKPNLAKNPSPAPQRTASPVPIEVQKPPPPEPLRSDGKLEVLSPDQAAAARIRPPTAAYIPAPPPALPAVEPQARAPSYSVAPPLPAVRQPPPLAAAPPAAQTLPTPGPAARAGFDCSAARSAAETMVCGDPELAAADREMTRAYRRALRSGAAPAGAIRADQRDWLAIREEAARHSRRALASVYQQRIEELNAAAEDGDGPGQ